MADQFIVLIGSAVGNMADGYKTVYNWCEAPFCSRAEAIDAGWALLNSDDFNIGVIRDGRLVDLTWMEQGGKADASELHDIDQQIALIAQEAPDAR